jgi:hypothetical protein
MSTNPPIGELILAADTGDRVKAGVLVSALYREVHGIAER